MAKSKLQKQQEAHFRAIRGELVHAFRAGTDEKVRVEYGDWYIDKRETLWGRYLELPADWRETAMEGWMVPENLQKRLALEAVERQAQDLQQATQTVDAPRRRVRL